MRKKFASALIASLVLTQLTGCSLFQKVTAEDLVIDGFNTLANAESYDLDMELIVGVKAEVEEGVNMDMGINADINIEGEEDITHFKGDMGIEFMGMSMTEELESWVEVDGDTTYTYDYSAEDDAWYVSEEDTEDEDEDKVKFVKVNIDQAPEIAEKYFVMSIPTLKFIDNGELKGSFVGAMSPDELEEWVDERL